MAHTPTRQDAKVAVTIRLDPVRVRQLQAVAEAENRSLTNYVETALLRDLAQRDEASRVITMLAAPGVAEQVAAGAIVRGASETDAAYAKRQDLMTELWSIPDSD
jgi:predicted transcriptional regulator